MKKILPLLFILCMNLYSNEVPKEMLGNWHIDIEATFKKLKNFKAYKIPESEYQKMDAMKEQMKHAGMIIGPDNFKSYMDEKETIINVTKIEITSYENKTLKFKSATPTPIDLKVSFILLDQNVLCLRRGGEPDVIFNRNKTKQP
ncbi:hypothetical protein PQO03_02505 [Lentisphaera profundi]|uniref:Lipocalin-like domain-containing protein n=1 Tax=Lentisphaera profundi TaxID=1658616 RepID=A0ABY7VRL1_9BACT|nr:hypothetical protein [Lentisphaera profundi]WDE96831.1 hypothetical protein PQO03_02505 [Lentisphaera profundi]